jgi:protein phosphatase
VSFRILHSGLTDTGRVRIGNEDAWAADPAQGLYIVADGMGGHNAGEIAAQLVVDSLPKLVRKRIGTDGSAPRTTQALARRLRSAVARLNREVYAHSMSEPGLHGMGATVVLALVRGGEAVVVHMGDSRAYLLRDGKLKLLTKDHSVVQELIDIGEITEAEAATHPERNRITASVGMPGDATPDSRRVPLRAGDKLLLCSDGLANMVPDPEIGQILGRCRCPEMVCQDLIDAANVAGGQDNITAVVVEVQEPADVETGAASSG